MYKIYKIVLIELIWEGNGSKLWHYAEKYKVPNDVHGSEMPEHHDVHIALNPKEPELNNLFSKNRLQNISPDKTRDYCFYLFLNQKKSLISHILSFSNLKAKKLKITKHPIPLSTKESEKYLPKKKKK